MTTDGTVLQTGDPAAVGMSAAQLERAFGLLTVAIEAGQISAASLTVARHGQEVFARGAGQQKPNTGQPVDADSIFLLASITKPVTACALMTLVDRGLISLDDPAADYLPEFTGGDRPSIKVRHLLSHISGMPDMLPENVSLRRAHEPVEVFVERAMQTPLLYKPATDFRYQSKGILLAAAIVERVSGQRLRDFEREEIFAPLGMERSALGMGDWPIEDTVWCGTDTEEDEELRSWGWNSPYWRDFGAPWGGMHSTGRDLASPLANHAQRRRVRRPAHLQPGCGRGDDAGPERDARRAVGPWMGRVRGAGVGLLGRSGVAAHLRPHRGDRHGGVGGCRAPAKLRGADQPNGRQRELAAAGFQRGIGSRRRIMP